MLTDKQKFILNKKFSWVQLDDPAFADTLDLILNTKKNLFIVGSGGTGKSVLLRLATAMLDGNTVCLSTTGVSAANLASEDIVSSTVHSFFRLPPVEIIDTPPLYPDIASVMRRTDTILVDEISMLNASVYDSIMKILKQYRKMSDCTPLPRIILFGDVLQLPPVINEKDENVKHLFERRYGGNYMFFNADEYKDNDFKVVHLNHIYRQSDDVWRTTLNHIRTGEVTNADLDVVNSRVIPEKKFIKEHPLMMYLATTNAKVKALNDFYLDSDNSITYYGVIKDKYDLKNTKLEMEVSIAPSMQIMCLRNNVEKGYQNGTLARALAVKKDCVIAEKFDGSEIEIGRENWESYKYTYDEVNDKVEHQVTGSFNQIGCKPAFAVTVHKSQSLTLDAMYLDTYGLSFMGSSLAYVALSRVKTLDGVGLTAPLKKSDIKTNIEGLMFLEKECL